MKMNSRIFFLHIIFFAYSFSLSAQKHYEVLVNIQDLEENKEAKITIIPPKIDAKTATFIMPMHYFSEIYGSINIKKYVKKFKALNEKNKPLKYEFVSNNGIVIYKAKELAKIEYAINIKDLDYLFYIDKQEVSKEKRKSLVFEHHNFFGYLQAYSNIPFHIEIQKSSNNLYPATALRLAAKSAKVDTFSVPNYSTLFSKPILYAPADTTSFRVGNTNFHVAIFSESGRVKAYQIHNYLRNVTEGIYAFLGNFPLKNYHFTMYFSEQKLSRSSDLSTFGGSMCTNASFYRLPELREAKKMKKVIYKIASHELLHLFSPYELHSEKAHHNGLESENISQHLWLYEGVTEYLSCLALKEAGLWSDEVFWNEISRKIGLSEQFETFSLTKMSEHIYQKKYRKAFPNFYYRGALVAFLLDIEIQKCSENSENLLSILQKMTVKYGHEEPFDDENFIDELVAMTCSEVQVFFDTYIIGTEKLPFSSYFDEINMTYFEAYIDTLGTYGKFVLWPNYKKGLMEFKKIERNELNLQNGDMLLSINGEMITTANFNKYKTLLYQPKPKAEIVLEVIGSENIRHKKDINSDFVQKNKRVLQTKAAIYIQKRKHYFLKK
ncbi:MAG: hypothetical protein ACPG5B_11590 [Chitinophagales bacterium]